jgi:hypothetical protein
VLHAPGNRCREISRSDKVEIPPRLKIRDLISVPAAAVAMRVLIVGVNRKRGRVLYVERAKADVVRTAATHIDAIVRDQLEHRKPGADLIDQILTLRVFHLAASKNGALLGRAAPVFDLLAEKTIKLRDRD